MPRIPAPAAASLALALAAAVGLQACRTPPPADVIAADGVLCDITQRLAASNMRVSCLLQPGDDPHQFRLTPQQSRELSQAQLVLINGFGLTPALAELTKPGSSQTKTVAVAELAVPNSPVLEAAQPKTADSHQHRDEHGQHHDEEEHAHGDRDPHVWHDPTQAAALVLLVAQQLQQLKPAAQAPIAARAQAMTTTLQQLNAWNRRQLATIPTASPLATGHRAFASLARAYGLEELAVVDASSGSDTLRPQAFQAVLEQLRREQVPMLFAEQLPAGKALQRVSSLSGVPIAAAPLVADGLAAEPDGNGNLVATLAANTCLIVNGLGGRCDASGQQALSQRWKAIR
ncbi:MULTISPECIES: metal ABC transporter substrate-binding protein [Cyanobium]|uniref:ABC transporter substrate-binding protein n=1 Tax=Cyanobium usitatum str. Tous TaxID=2116684 RepID=A0A2P7MVG8_9CYAN|nr:MULTISPECIES: metal ABC transporter substrate-binding protein [Cyanobium]MCP9780593.1 zinc ABC transporter substrate-binding protein [Cyanobium sp. To12R1]PSJ05207.1 ABC transporter substrate-binding protein [Cyanobium usitatum str. Tous]